MHYVNKGWHDVGCAKQRVISAALEHLIVDYVLDDTGNVMTQRATHRDQ